MVLTCSRNGFLAAWRTPGLAILLWAWSALLALPLAVPAWTWLHSVTAGTPEADLLLDRFSFGVTADLLRTDPSLNLLVPAFLATVIAAVVGQALTSGGLIEVLTSDDARPFLHRFFRGAGHFFWRFLRAGIYAWLLCGIGSVIVEVAFGPVSRALQETDWEPAWYLGLAARLLILALLVLVVTLAFDYARIRMAREDSRRALRAFIDSLWFVVRHPKATFGVWLVMAVALAAAYAVYVTYRTYVPSNTWGLILLMAVAQQITLLVAAGLRVALVGSEIAVWERYRPGVSSLESGVLSRPVESEPPLVTGSTSQVTGSSALTIETSRG